MTFDRDRHAEFEELISASLQGDLTADERRRLDGHLDTCPACRATLAAFSDQRRIMAGLRHVPVPRDLGARVRAGVEQREARRRWWQRPPAIFAGVGGGLAVVTGVLLALVLLGNPDDPEVGDASPTPIAPVTSATPIPTLPPLETPAATEPPASVAPSESVAPAPTATPVQASPEPDSYLAVTGPPDNQAMTLRDGTTRETLREVETPPGVPVAAELSPDGQWLAYIVDVGTGSGFTEIRATRIAEGVPSDEPGAPPPVDSPIAVGETAPLAESVGGNPFVEHLFWSSNSQYLAFTVVDRVEGGTDVWIFQPSTGVASRMTDLGNAYAGSWVPGGAGTSLLWISTAGERPESHLRMIHDSASDIAPTDLADSPFPAATDVFQPILSPNGALVIFWTGRMHEAGEGWSFVEGGAPWLAENRQDGELGYRFESNRRLFTDVTVDRDAFTSAAIGWAPDSNTFVVWDAEWTGISQAAGTYPDQRRVYLGRASDPTHVTWRHALDVGDLPEDASVVDVKVAGTGRHLAVTARHPLAGLELPQADLLLITRNFDDVPDDVIDLEPDRDGWFGPAVYSASEWAELVGD